MLNDVSIILTFSLLFIVQMPMQWLDMQAPEMHSEHRHRNNKDVPLPCLSGFSLWGKAFKEKVWGLRWPQCNMDRKSPNSAAHQAESLHCYQDTQKLLILNQDIKKQHADMLSLGDSSIFTSIVPHLHSSLAENCVKIRVFRVKQ